MSLIYVWSDILNILLLMINIEAKSFPNFSNSLLMVTFTLNEQPEVDDEKRTRINSQTNPKNPKRNQINNKNNDPK